MMKLRRMRQVGFVTCMGEIRNAYKILARKPEENRSLRRYTADTRWWEDNIKMDCRNIGYGLDSYDSGLGSVAVCCEHDNEPSCSIKAGSFID
jgi:hypothetical protein